MKPSVDIFNVVHVTKSFLHLSQHCLNHSCAPPKWSTFQRVV